MMVVWRMVVMVVMMCGWSANILRCIGVEAEGGERVAGLRSANNGEVVVWFVMVMMVAATGQLSEL